MQVREDWLGKLASVGRAEPTETLAAYVRTTGSGAGAFLALMESRKPYWVKVPDNPQGTQVLVNEQVVAGVGELVGAAVAQTALIHIPDDLAGWSFADGRRVRGCVAHGSLHIESSEEIDVLVHRDSDDNARRQPSILALWDWCMGTDPQWLYALESDKSVWSFDHGMWFGGETGWTSDDLQKLVDVPWQMRDFGSVKGMDRAVFHELANRIESVDCEQLLGVVASVPSDWQVPDEDLESVAWFLYRRREGVAERLRRLAVHR